MSMLMIAEALCDYLPHGTEVFDDDALDAAAVAARSAWIEALGFTAAERKELVDRLEASQAAWRAKREAMTDEELDDEMSKSLAEIRQRRDAFLADLEPSTAQAA